MLTRRIFAIALAVAVLLLAGVPLQVYATSGITFTVGSNVSAIRGGTVTVPITVSNNSGFTAAGLVVSYDPNVLEITEVTAPVAAMPLNPQFTLTSAQGTQWIHLINTGLVDWGGRGVVAYISFNVRTNAAIGVSPIALAFTTVPDGRPVNEGGNILTSAATIPGSVSVTDGGVNPVYPVYPVHPVYPVYPIIPEVVDVEPQLPIVEDSDQHQMPEQTPFDDGEFIGTPYISDDIGSGIDTTEPGATAPPANFGRVPQTGLIIAMCASLLTTVSLLGYLIYRVYRHMTRISNGSPRGR
jgi:hypothetical protein